MCFPECDWIERPFDLLSAAATELNRLVTAENQGRGSPCSFLKTEDWSNVRIFNIKDLMIQILRFGDLKTALFCEFLPQIYDEIIREHILNLKIQKVLLYAGSPRAELNSANTERRQFFGKLNSMYFIFHHVHCLYRGINLVQV